MTTLFDDGFRGEFREILPPERLVNTFEFEGYTGQVAVETLTFREENGKTTLTSVMLFDSPSDRDGMLQSGMEEKCGEDFRPARRISRDLGLSAMFDSLSTTFAALADPTRRAILARITSGQASVTELAEPFEMRMPAISKHLKVLERTGLIARGREAQWRPCRLEAAPLKDVAHWLEQYRAFWEESFERLDDYFIEMKRKGKKRGRGERQP